MRNRSASPVRGLSGLGRLWRRWFAVRRGAPVSRRPQLEALEDRRVPAVLRPTYLLAGGPGDFSPLSSTGPVGYSPAQVRQAYGFNLIVFNGGVTGDGAGQTIAIVDAGDDPTIVADLLTFDVAYGLAAPPSFKVVNQSGGSTLPLPVSGWPLEIALDVEWAHAIAPAANILLVEADSANNSDMNAAVVYAAGQAAVVSMSFGESESALSQPQQASYDTIFTGTSGVTYVAASGDSGAPPIWPSSSPYVVAAGGTHLSLSGNTYVSESGWSGSGGGISIHEAQPAFQQGLTIHDGTNLVNSNGFRTTPDVAFDSDPATGFGVVDSFDYGTIAPWVKVGGTSAASPQLAALFAIANQGRVRNGRTNLDGPTQTLPYLYGLPSGDYHDVTTGTSTGIPNYTAAAGYDLVTGLGSPLANLVAVHLSGAPLQYHFAPATAPAVSGYTQATEKTSYNAVLGYGWLSGSDVQSFDRGVGTNLTRAFCYTTTSATFAVDLPNGTYTVTLQMGDTVYAHQGMGVFFQGTQVDNLSNAAGQVLSKSYVVNVTNGQLDLGLQALGGTNTAAVIEGMEIVAGTPPPPTQYDFGTAASPVASGYAAVTEGTTYSAASGYGWLSGGVASADRGVGSDLTRDFNYTTTQATFAVDLANGTYTVTLQLGDTGPYAHQGMGIFFQGAQVDNLSSAAGQVLSKSYVVTVTNGQLDLGLQALGGTNTAAVIEGMEIVAGTPPPPTQYDFGTAASAVASGYTAVNETTTYSAASGYGWLSGGVASADRGVGTSLTRDFNYTTTSATFAVDLANGTYTVTLRLGDTVYAHQGMGIFFQGAQVDNVANIAGQILTNSYVVTVTNGQLDLGLQALGGTNTAAVIEGMEIVTGSPPAQFDFGTASSPATAGYAAVTEATAYNAATHFGWLSGSGVASADRGVGTSLTSDFNYTTTSATFAVDLANGTYNVTLQMGDMSYAHQGMGVFFQGTQVDNLSNAAGQIITKTYSVTVTNGQLDLGLQALGGANSAAVIEGMEIASA
jgi:fibronectin type 3 domain-containing protein